MAITRTEFINKVKRRLGEPLVKVELCDEQIVDHIDYARQKYIKWATGNATQELYFTLLLQAGKRFYDLPAGVLSVIDYDDTPISSGGINTLFTIDNFMFMNGYFGNIFWGGYDMVSYHLVLDFMSTLKRYRTTPYNYRYHKSTNQIEVNPVPAYGNSLKPITITNPETGLPQEYYVDSPGWVLVRSYMIEGSTLPDYRPDWNDVLKERRLLVERHYITQEDVDRKYFILNNEPHMNDADDYNLPYDMNITVDSIVLKKGTSWYLHADNNKIVTWDGLEEMEDTVAVGDLFEVSYPVIFESQYFPDSWTDVTATTTEVEQFVVDQTILDNDQLMLQFDVWNDNIKFVAGGVTHDLTTDYIVDATDTKVVSWRGLGLEGQLELDDEIAITYVTPRSYQPSYESRSSSVFKQYYTRIENRILTADEETNKAIVLSETASVSSGVKLSTGATERIFGIDFTVTGDTLSWNGLGMEGIVAGDSIIVTYTAATPLESEVEEPLYDNDWMLDYVTAMSKITLGTIRRKFANFSSLGNQGISLDGDALISDGQSEKDYLEQTLRDEEAYEGYGIEIGFM